MVMTITRYVSPSAERAEVKSWPATRGDPGGNQIVLVAMSLLAGAGLLVLSDPFV